MSARIPADAFDFYASLGMARSYQAVAEKYGVSKQAVTKHAVQHRWAERLTAIEQRARERSDQKLQETIEELNERHLKMLRIIETKALEALRVMPLDSAMDAVRALEISMRQTRLIRGEPTDHTTVDVVDLIRREHSDWLLRPGGEGECWDELAAEAKDGRTAELPEKEGADGEP